MNPLQGLSEYLGKIERRLKVLTFSRGAALTAGAALGFTVAGVLIANHFAFSESSVLSVRVVLFLALAAALGAGLVTPLLHLNRRRAAREAERKFPRFEERLLTFSERAAENARDPFLELLAADALDVARESEPDRVAPWKRILGLASMAVAAAAVLVWLGTSGPGFLGYGTSLLWGAVPKSEIRPFYDIVVEPGDRTVRRRADLRVTARLMGFESPRVRLLAKYSGSSKWEEAVMRPEAGGTRYEFLFAAVPESLEYYVEAGAVRSRSYKLNVADLAGVTRLRVTYHYPAWTGLPEKTEDPGGDLRAVEGTEAEVEVQTDKPLAGGMLELDDGKRIELRNSRARVPLRKDGLYHVAAVEQGEAVRLTEDYFIEAQKDAPPAVRITRPGRDTKVNPIEEVAVAVEAQDDFGLKSVELHYSVNGGPEKTVAIAEGKSRKTAEGLATLSLEDFKMAPGDVISLYASARDARSTANTDRFFVLAEPFEREFTQSQQMGGGGGGGGDDDERAISARQREIISATWNQLKSKSSSPAADAENAKFLADMEGKLRDQAASLARRMRSRELAGSNPAFQSFAEDMDKAAESMTAAADKLRGRAWQAALPPEEKALQHLSRAEATFRQIQVAFGSRGGGGGGGAGRDLENLFDLELDTEKNQYESGQQSASADQRQKQIDEALQKLEELARRQQELADQQRRNQQAFQQRWQQEMLRREAEQLQKQIEQMARNQQGQQGQSGQQGQTGQPGQSGGRGAQSAALDRALQRLNEATRDMRSAASSQNNGSAQGDAEARRAVERLREARETLAGLRQQQAGEQLDELSQKTQRLAGQQEDFAKRLRETVGGAAGQAPNLGQYQQAQGLAQEKLKMLDDLKQLEQQMQNAASALAGSERAASSKLRQALGNMQQDELGLKMKWSAEALRRGLGQAALSREGPVTQGLNQLRDQVREAQNALGRGQKNGQGGVEQALAETERLRRQLEQLGREAEGRERGQRGQQPGQPGRQNGGQQDSEGGQQGGQTSGQGQRGEGAAGGPDAGAYTGGGPAGLGGPGFRGPYDPGTAGRILREGVRDLSQIQRLLEGNRDVAADVQALVRQWQALQRQSGVSTGPLLDDRIRGQLLGGIEQIELQLRRLMDEKLGGNVRSGASQPVPPGYADAVAEYFRRLSKDK